MCINICIIYIQFLSFPFVVLSLDEISRRNLVGQPLAVRISTQICIFVPCAYYNVRVKSACVRAATDNRLQ